MLSSSLLLPFDSDGFNFNKVSSESLFFEHRVPEIYTTGWVRRMESKGAFGWAEELEKRAHHTGKGEGENELITFLKLPLVRLLSLIYILRAYHSLQRALLLNLFSLPRFPSQNTRRRSMGTSPKGELSFPSSLSSASTSLPSKHTHSPSPPCTPLRSPTDSL